MRTGPYPIVRCKNPACRRPFSSHPRRDRRGVVKWTQHCSWACSQATVKARQQGKPMTAAMAALSVLREQKRKQRLEDLFGTLTDREVELMRRAGVRAYHQGYAAGRRAEYRRWIA